MSHKILNEQDLRVKLQRSGKSSEEIESLIAAYVTAAESKSPDTQVIGSLLQKGQQDKYLRVISFNLTNEPYDTLASYFEEAGVIAPGQKVKADFLVKKAIDEFIAMLS